MRIVQCALCNVHVHCAMCIVHAPDLGDCRPDELYESREESERGDPVLEKDRDLKCDPPSVERGDGVPLPWIEELNGKSDTPMSPPSPWSYDLASKLLISLLTVPLCLDVVSSARCHPVHRGPVTPMVRPRGFLG